MCCIQTVQNAAVRLVTGKKSKSKQDEFILYNTFLCPVSKALGYGPNVITQFYLPPTHEPYLPLLATRMVSLPFAGTHCTFPRRDGQAELTWVADNILR